MLAHIKDDPTDDRYERLVLAQQEPEKDGLSSLHYSLLATNHSESHTHLLVDI